MDDILGHRPASKTALLLDHFIKNLATEKASLNSDV